MEVLLTKKEIEIVNLIVDEGLTNPQIAKRLDKSILTVQHQLCAIYRACGISVVKDYRRFELYKRIKDGNLTITRRRA